jgi:hypothetical protein
MSPRGHDRKFQGDLISVGARVAVVCSADSWFGSPSQKLGVVFSAGTAPGTSRRARRFNMQLPIYSVRLDDGRVITIEGNSDISIVGTEVVAKEMGEA